MSHILDRKLYILYLKVKMGPIDEVPEHQTPSPPEKLPPIDERLTKTPEEASIMEQMLRDQLAMIKNLSAYLPVELAIVVVQRPKEYSDALKNGTTKDLLGRIRESDPVYQFIAESKKEPVQAAITSNPTPTPTPMPRETPSPILTPTPPLPTPSETPGPTQPQFEPTPTPMPPQPQKPYPVAPPTPTAVPSMPYPETPRRETPTPSPLPPPQVPTSLPAQPAPVESPVSPLIPTTPDELLQKGTLPAIPPTPPIDNQLQEEFAKTPVREITGAPTEPAVVPQEFHDAFSGNSPDNVIFDPDSPPKT